MLAENPEISFPTETRLLEDLFQGLHLFSFLEVVFNRLFERPFWIVQPLPKAGDVKHGGGRTSQPRALEILSAILLAFSKAVGDH